MKDAPDDADEVRAVEFGDYMRAQYPDLMGFATILTGTPWLAEDLVNDVLGKAFERWARISAVDYPHAYVRRMVINEYTDRRRRIRFTLPVERVPPTRGEALDRRSTPMLVVVGGAPPSHEAGEAP